jgi:AbrB family looped-hinge helix DNA binding protein
VATFFGAMMASATVTAKGQVTIPASVRAALGLDAGSRVEFIETGAGQFAIVPVTVSVEALKGLLRKPAKPVSVEDMIVAPKNYRSGRGAVIQKK